MRARGGAARRDGDEGNFGTFVQMLFHMKKMTFFHLIVILFIAGSLEPVRCSAQDKPAQPVPTLRSILLEQYKTTYNVQDWFVPATKSVEGLSAEQAIWKPCDSCHSVAQEVTHIIFWDKEQLAKFRGEKPDAFDGNNSKTFVNMDKAQWAAIVAQLNQVLGDIQKMIENADDAKLQGMASAITHISAHHAYHTGQILFIRKMQGSWNPENGVK
jgi:uncharacterized damage-inducible protein DinB